MTHLLDTSALLAFYFGEPGAERVREILSAPQSSVALSVLTTAEFWSRLRADGKEQAFDPHWRRLRELIGDLVPVTLPVALKSIALRQAATARLPLIDALIAATAAQHDAVLVHRDPHFSAIPAHLLKQELLPVE